MIFVISAVINALHPQKGRRACRESAPSNPGHGRRGMGRRVALKNHPGCRANWNADNSTLLRLYEFSTWLSFSRAGARFPRRRLPIRGIDGRGFDFVDLVTAGRADLGHVAPESLERKTPWRNSRRRECDRKELGRGVSGCPSKAASCQGARNLADRESAVVAVLPRADVERGG